MHETTLNPHSSHSPLTSHHHHPPPPPQTQSEAEIKAILEEAQGLRNVNGHHHPKTNFDADVDNLVDNPQML